MKQIYIVLEGGCLRYVSSDSTEVIKTIGVTLIDLDNKDDLADPEAFQAAQTAVRIW